MKAILPRPALQDALAAVASLASGRTTKPILSCVKLKAADGEMELCGTDGEAGLRLRIAALSVERAGEAVVTADRLLGIIRELGDVEIALEVTERHCIIRGAGSEFRIFTMNPGDFPPVPGFDDEPDLSISAAELRRMIHLTLYAAARETSRYAINGVLWEKRGKKLFLVATDGRRLARAGGTLKNASSGDFEAIVPSKALGVLEKAFPAGKDTDAIIDVKVMPNQVMLRSDGRVLSSILVEGHFPKYDEVIPKNNDKLARADKQAFYAAIRRAALLTTEESRAVKLALSPDGLVITSQSPEQGDARIELPIRYEGEAIEIGFNPAFLSDALRVMPHEEIVIELHESFRPGIIRGEDAAEFLYVVMPVSLAG